MVVKLTSPVRGAAVPGQAGLPPVEVLRPLRGTAPVIIASPHSGRTYPERFIEQAAPALASYADGSVAKISAGVQRAKDAKVADDDDEMLEFLNARAGSRARARAMLELHEHEEGFPARSAWDAGQAMTAYARRSIYQDERVALEREAGKVLTKAAA